MTDRWIKTYEKLLKWEWYGDPIMVATWIHLLLKANWSDKKWRGITINRGQLITSRTRLSDEVGTSEQQTRTCLERLQNSGEITCEATNRYTIITICNYESYQGTRETEQPAEQPTEQLINNQQATNKRPTKRQQTTTPIEYIDKTKNLYNSKEDEDDSAQEMPSVVVGLLDFLRNIYGDFNFTPSQVQLVTSKPAEYWDYFMNEIEASKWLKSKDPALALRLHDKVVNGEYRTYERQEQPTPPPAPVYTPSPEQRQLDDLLDEWRTIKGVNDDERLKEMERRHPQLPDNFRKTIGMCWFRNNWYWKA